MTGALQVITTLDNRDVLDRLAYELISRRQAACVQISGPVTSIFRWNHEIETAEEWLCIIKTHQSRYDAVEATIRELHTYQVPEIIAVPIVACGASYLAWIKEETTDLVPSGAGPVEPPEHSADHQSRYKQHPVL
jgi:periplasmic divalent cation tolerance protein